VAINSQQRAEFVNAYTSALITAWSSEEYAHKLEQRPVEALREVGLELPANAQVVLVRTIPEGHHEANLDIQIGLYELGLATGRFELHIPETPQVDMAELSEGDLDGVAAAGGIYCCCCPCCCCT
jgi:hypothetical protein